MNYKFLTVDTNEVIFPKNITFDESNNYDVLTGYTVANPEIREFAKGTYKCLSEGIEVPGVGIIRDGDLIKINMFDKTFYTVHFGWYTTNDGLDLYGWYLVNNERVQSFYKRYIETLEIVQFCGKCGL